MAINLKLEEEEEEEKKKKKGEKKKKKYEDVLLVEFMYLVSARMPGESYRRRLRSLLLYLCYVFRALINSLVCSFRGY